MHSSVVIQWNRLGDLLQTRVLLRQLRSQDSDRIVLCCDARYALIAKLFPEVDDVWPVDLTKLTSLARHGNTQAEFVVALRDLVEADKTPVTDVYTLTRSLTAATYAELLGPEYTFGYRLDRDTLQIPPVIGSLDLSQGNHESAVVHLSDRWASFAGRNTNPTWLEPLLLDERPETESCRNVALIYDAGEEYRRIPLDWQVTLLNHLLGSGDYRISLLGYKAGMDELHNVAQNHPQQVSDLRGQTSLLELCHVLAEQQLVMGSDSGGLHLAASLGIPVIGLYFGGADCRHTGPYSSASYILQEPQWDATTINAILGLSQAICSEDRSNVDQSLVCWQPALDEYGMIYSSSTTDSASLTAIKDTRKDFFTALWSNHNSICQISATQCSSHHKSVSIIIPERGGRHYTTELLADLNRELSGAEHEIILVSSESIGAVPATSNLTHLQCPEPLTFAQACNRGAEQAKHNLLLFLNNDTRIPDGGLTPLLDSFRENEIASPVIVYPDGLIQNAGVMITEDGIRELSHGQLHRKHNEECDAVSGVALLVHRSVFNNLNGFDEHYSNGYEDLDFCLRAHDYGVNFRVAEEAEIVHYRGSSVGRFTNEDSNFQRFSHQWSGRVRKSATDNSANETIGFCPLIILSDEPEESAGCRLRWIWPLERKGYQCGVDFTFVQTKNAEQDINEFSELLMSAQAVVVFRPISSEIVQSVLLDSLKLSCAKLLVDLDDMILGRFPEYSPRAQERENYESAFRTLMSEADILTASTTDLLLHLLQNGFKAEYLPSSPDGRMLNPQGLVKPSTDEIHIGFFGTPSHLLDLGSILPALERLLEANENLRFYWWGCRPGELAYHQQVRQGGPVVSDYLTHLQRLHSFPLDIVVVPLLDSPSNRVKTAIKYFEYAGAGLPAVYSGTKPYSEAVVHGETGLLAADGTESWIAQIDRLIKDRALRDSLSSSAYQHMKQMTKDRCEIFSSVISRLLAEKSDKPQEVLACLA